MKDMDKNFELYNEEELDEIAEGIHVEQIIFHSQLAGAGVMLHDRSHKSGYERLVQRRLIICLIRKCELQLAIFYEILQWFAIQCGK